jgi:hypothetical protein
MIPFLTHTILDENSPQQDNQGRQFHPHGFQPQQNYQARQPLLHLQTLVLWGHQVMIFVR